MEATTFICQERQPISIPIEYVLSKSGEIDILPDVISQGFFDIDFRSGKLVLVAGKFIGLIPINNKVTIDVRPKLAVKDLLHVLSIAEEDLAPLDFFSRLYDEVESPNDSITSLLLRSLLRQLHTIMQEGLAKEFIRRASIGVFKPRVQFGRTLQKCWSKGRFDLTSNEIFEFSRDIALNQLVKFALWRNLSAISALPPSAREDFASIYSLFDRVTLDTTLKCIPDCIELVKNDRIPVIRKYYADIVRTCLLLVGDRAVDLAAKNPDVRLLSCVLNLEDIFEKYTRNVLRARLNARGPSVKLLDGNAEGKSFLFHDNNQDYPIKPDVVFVHDNRPQVVLDAKYKPKLSESDRYQVISHAISLGCHSAVLVLPRSGNAKAGLVRLGQLWNGSGIEVFEYHLDLELPFEEQEQQFADCIYSLSRPAVAA